MIEASIDDGGLAAMLGRVSPEVVAGARKVVAKGAVNIKKAMREDAAESAHFRRIGPTITYTQVGLTAEVGPEKRAAGPLANIAYFGGARGGGGTVRDPARALEEEQPRFLRALLDVIEEATQ